MEWKYFAILLSCVFGIVVVQFYANDIDEYQLIAWNAE